MLYSLSMRVQPRWIVCRKADVMVFHLTRLAGLRCLISIAALSGEGWLCQDTAWVPGAVLSGRQASVFNH